MGGCFGLVKPGRATLRIVAPTAARYGVVPVGQVASVDKGPNAGKKAVYLRDPDGITIEFVGA